MLLTREGRRESTSVLTTVERRGEPCVERVERKRRESEGDGWCEGRVTEEGIACPSPSSKPLSRTLLCYTSATCGTVSGMTHK